MGEEGKEMMKTELRIIDDAVYEFTPMPQCGEGVVSTHPVMTKEIFKECYKKWILEEEKTYIKIEGAVNDTNITNK